MIQINMEKAKEICRIKLREYRRPLLEKLDISFMKALEEGNTQVISEIGVEKQFLRDITNDPRIETAKTIDDLHVVLSSFIVGK